MKLIVAGSRDLDEGTVYAEMAKLRSEGHVLAQATEIVSGCARGADTAGERYARSFGIPVKKFPADWSKYGKSAGPMRNRQMAEYGDVLLLIWDGKSRGSANMKSQMVTRNKKVYEVIL